MVNDFWRSLRWAWSLSLVFGGLSLLWSAVGFFSPTVPTHFHEYPLRSLAVEVGGHVLFGLAVAAPTLDPALILLSGGESILIDSDHLLSALNLPVEARLAHSVGFMVVAPLLMAAVAAKGKQGFGRPVAMVTLGAALAHISYDVFAGNGQVPFLAPLYLGTFTFPYWTWVPFELTGIALCAYAGFAFRRRSHAQTAGGSSGLSPQL